MKSKDKTKKLEGAIKFLERALEFESKAKKDEFYHAGISKAFETCLDYAWKYFKREANEQGLEAYGPKDSVKMAASMGLIEDAEIWLEFIAGRNLAVHDYGGISHEDYLKTIKAFFREVKKLKL